jgi:hypothetical protein
MSRKEKNLEQELAVKVTGVTFNKDRGQAVPFPLFQEKCKLLIGAPASEGRKKLWTLSMETQLLLTLPGHWRLLND